MKQPIPIIDTDIHHTPDHQEVLKRMPTALAKRGIQNPGMMGFGNPHGVMREDARPPSGGAACSDPGFTIEHFMEPRNIHYGVLNPAGLMAMGVSADYRAAAAVCSAYNDYMIDSWLAFDQRFLGAVMVGGNWPEAAAKEIRRVGHHPQMKTIIMCSASEAPLGQVRYWPIYEAAQEMGLPVTVHPGAEGRGISGPPSASGWPSSYFEWHTGLSQNYMGHVSSLILEGVFQEFPELMFIGLEGGFAWLPHLMWRLDKNWKALRVLTPWLTEPPSAVIKKHIRLSTQPIEEPEKPEHLMQIIDMIDGENTLVFSSDYPHWDNDDPFYAFPSSMPQETKERIFWKNAADMLDLEVASPVPA